MLGAITLGTFESILGALQLSQEELLQKSLSQNYPFLNGYFKIWCVQGKIRALAARLAFGEKAWWAVKLHTEAAENAKVSEELPVQIDATTALSFAHVFGEEEEEEL
ncbi:hypothetical protein HD806DRAFT_532171 [Xylariaceae sp. AK1471]|nr:hypothetical protein HD806DRAFT_532171 [Xylariaceae sp. AK1471]